jgi:monoamine oxidase
MVCELRPIVLRWRSMSAADSGNADVVVVGGGFSGLAAACRLHDAGSSVVVLEARDRVGGRVETAHPRPGAWLDLGGTWVGPTQPRILELADEYAVEIIDQFDEGARLLELDGRVRRYKGTIPRLGPLTLLDIARMQFEVARAARKVAPPSPTPDQRTVALDSVSLDQWLAARRHGRRGRALLAAAGKTIWGAEAGELSMLYVLRELNAAGGLDALLDTEGGAQHARFVGGAQELALRMAAKLGERVLLGQSVSRIAADRDGVTVGGDGFEIRAGQVVVALPPPLCSAIDFTPELPSARRDLQEDCRMGMLTKCFAIYDEPFWRADGLSGESISDSGPATLTFDVSPPDGSCGVLLGFVGGDDARALEGLSDGEASKVVLEGFARLFGPRASGADQWAMRAWGAEHFSAGAPVMIAPPGSFAASETSLREPHGRVLWASSEASERWTGYIEGAVLAGEAAAKLALGRS